MTQNEQGSNTSPPDPCENLRDRIDPEATIHSDHQALDGGEHVLPEDVERFEADQWHAVQQQARDEDNQPAGDEEGQP